MKQNKRNSKEIYQQEENNKILYGKTSNESKNRQKRRKELPIVAFFIIMAVLITCVGCESDKAEHTHEFGAWTMTKEATCLVAGTEERVCACGEKETREISAKGHAFEKQDTEKEHLKSDATCTRSATYFYSCTRCGANGTETFENGEPLSHTFDREVATETYLYSSATCTQSAVYYRSCVCGEIGTETFENGEPLPHTFDREVATESYLLMSANCTESAVYYYSCECGAKSENTFEYGQPNGHKYEDEATCHDRKCKNCEHIETATATHTFESNLTCIDRICTVCGETQEATAVHVFDQEVLLEKYWVTNANCTETAKYYYSCLCGTKGENTFESGQPNGHKYEDEATCHDRKCKNCEHIEMATTNHIYDSELTCIDRNCMACGETQEATTVHVFDQMVAEEKYLKIGANCTESAKYYFSCACGTKGENTFESGQPNGHKYEDEATCHDRKCKNCEHIETATATHTFESNLTCIDRICTACGETQGATGLHNYDREVVLEKYLVTPATCTENAKYYYSCLCGAKGENTFRFGNLVAHEYADNHTCHDRKCLHCEYVETATTQHVFDEEGTVTKEATLLECGEETFVCLLCGETKTESIPKLEDKSGAVLLSATGFTMVENIGSASVSARTSVVSFSDLITVSPYATWTVSTDKEGTKIRVRKDFYVEYGQNVAYINVRSGDGTNSTQYTMNIYRKCLYTINFFTEEQRYIDCEDVEEGDILEDLPDLAKAGYTLHWDYDFSQPIMKNNNVFASWTANTDTPYSVKYYVQNTEDDDYTETETVTLYGTTDTTANAEVKTYEHFTYEEENEQNVLEGNIDGDGESVLKVYYTRNLYHVEIKVADTNIVLTNAINEEYRYGTEIDSVSATSNLLGYDWKGWYSGETLVANGDTLSAFSVEKEVTYVAVAEAKTEMKNFVFTATAVACKITDIKDDSITEIIVPDYVTEIDLGAFFGCNSLTSVTLPFVGASGNGTSNTHFGYIFGAKTYSANSSFVPTDLKTVTVTQATSVGDNAFYSCKGLTSVTIPNTVKNIGVLAFFKCTGLNSIEIPESVESIGESAFFGCQKLTSVTIPKKVTTLGESAFDSCRKLTTVVLLGDVTTIGEYAFADCESLTEIVLPDSVTTVESGAFLGCESLSKVYYTGSASDWSEIDTEEDNEPLTVTAVYYFSENTPSEEGSYWHYDSDGKIVTW